MKSEPPASCEQRPFVLDQKLPVVRWEGTSYCGVIGRAYGNLTRELTALEFGALRGCVGRHQFAEKLLRALNITASPSIGYDWGEATKFGANVAASTVAAVFFQEVEETKVLALYSAMLLNPTVAIPIHRSVNRAIRAARDAHDAYPLLAKVLTDSSLAASAVTDIMARDLPTLDKLEDSATYLVNTFGKLNITTGVVERAQRLYEEAATFKREAYVKAGIVSRRLLSTPSLLHAATCPVVSVFIADFQDPANLLVKHLQYNVPRSVCRLMYPQGGEVWNTKCGPPSWQVGLNTTPPLPPTPQLPKPPPPPFETGVVFKTGALHTYAFSLFYQATGFNVTSYFLVKAAEILGALPGPAHRGAPSEGLVLLDKKLQCAYDSSVQCLNKDRSLLYEVGYVALEITLLVTVLKVLREGWASTLAMSVGIFFFLPRVMSRTYNLLRQPLFGSRRVRPLSRWRPSTGPRRFPRRPPALSRWC